MNTALKSGIPNTILDKKLLLVIGPLNTIDKEETQTNIVFICSEQKEEEQIIYFLDIKNYFY